jgi:hypothetical protein
MARAEVGKGGTASHCCSGEISAKNLPEQRRQPGLVQLVSGDGDHGDVELILNRGCAACGDAIDFQKQRGRSDSRAFVPIEKTLGLRELEGVGCCDMTADASAESSKPGSRNPFAPPYRLSDFSCRSSTSLLFRELVEGNADLIHGISNSLLTRSAYWLESRA